MDEGGTGHEAGPRRGGVFFLRATAAFVAVSVLGTLTLDLVDKASLPAPAATTPAPEEASSRSRPVFDDRSRGPIVAKDQPTVYDAQDDLARCARSRRRVGPASTAAGLEDDIGRISTRLERIRGLDFDSPVETRLVPREEVGERFARGFRRQLSPEEAATRQRVAVALRLVPDETDLHTVATELVTEGVAGFYNPRAKRLFAGTTAGDLAPFDEVVLAHELDHALVDQVLGLPGTIARDPMLADVTLAHQTLAEGDATLAMSMYASERLGPDATAGFLQRFSGAAITPPPGVPYVLLRANEFPYYEGLLFACAAWKRGGWHAVDEVYARPPASTAEIVFPGRYRRPVEARLPPAPKSPPRRWEPVLTASLGAFDLMLLLENADLISAGETIPGGHVDEVRGWNGGVLRAWARGSDTAIHMALVDAGVDMQPGRQRHLCDVLRDWLLETFPEAVSADPGRREVRTWTTPDGMAGMRCRRSSVQLALGPSESLVRRLLPYVRTHPPTG